MSRTLRGPSFLLALAGLLGTLSCQRTATISSGSGSRVQAAERAEPPPGHSVRPTAVAGPGGAGFYPSDPVALQKMVNGLLAKATLPKLPGDLVAVVVPHAGFDYSAPVAAYAYKALQGGPYATVILLGCSHRVAFAEAALSPDDAWETPLGPVAVDRSTTKALLACGAPFIESREPHAEEHSLEVQLPFIKSVCPKARIVPILLGQVSPETCRRVATGLAPILKRPDVVLVASSDMAHYPAHDDCTRVDRQSLDAICSLDANRVREVDGKLLAAGTRNLDCTLCGLDAVVTGMIAAEGAGAIKASVLHYANSGDTAGMKVRCVGYGAVAITAPTGTRGKAAKPEGALSAEQRKRLLEIARQAILARLGAGSAPSLDSKGDPVLSRKAACFVTLKKKGELRGCIGSLVAFEPLVEAVAGRALAAAFEDPRFDPVALAEMRDIHIEISVMSPLRRASRPEEIVVGKHGVVVRQGWHSGVFLPQVATEQGWDRDTLLTELCLGKAGLPGDAWKKGAELQVFTADVFGERE